MSETELKVIEAAKGWLTAKEEMLAADVAHEHTEEAQRALDQAEFDLTSRCTACLAGSRISRARLVSLHAPGRTAPGQR
jgi:hypothetical protein